MLFGNLETWIEFLFCEAGQVVVVVSMNETNALE